MRILITGEKSYIGLKLKQWLNQWPDRYEVDNISLKNDVWKQKDLSIYDSIIHVAAIVHQKENSNSRNTFYLVNRDLTKALALKAKSSGVKHFVFLSSMSVYGLDGKIGAEVIIDKNTPCNPNTLYGKSKLAAEFELKKIMDERDFKVAIVRPPMVYGPDCPGNYARLSKLVKRSLVFPEYENKRSMIYIDNLTEFIRLIIDTQAQGLFFPQNKEYVNIKDLIDLIAKVNSKRIYFSTLLSKIMNLFKNRIEIFNKVFGNLTYNQELSSHQNFNYCITEFKESIINSELRNMNLESRWSHKNEDTAIGK
ncbi:NAD-dependent epimerase/dehydratase family protein [Cohnella laeviribosi]|jgi:UDP-glucose 4-epimerase|uniref:NAD-dependent epimerase/dehydratase family protein n=1 Tax=Cohnella laeviribosi TaxID=380174 RepID=UPI000361B212|nr:NAD-dependent epimerase/dehydratase family protein [Cohnella laeviribosi]